MRRRRLAGCRWHAATAGLFRRKANPSSSTTSSRTAYRSRRRFFMLQTSSLIHSVAPPFQLRPASLGSQLVRRPEGGCTTPLRKLCIACSDFFIVRARSRRCSSSPHKSSRFCGGPGFGDPVRGCRFSYLRMDETAALGGVPVARRNRRALPRTPLHFPSPENSA